MTRLTIAIAIAISALSTPSLTRAQSAPTPAAQPPAHPMPGQAPGAAMPAMPMMAMHEKMMADMKVMDAALDVLITKMNAATGAAKVNAMAEALTALVARHKTMYHGMMEMHGQMHGPMNSPMHPPTTKPMSAQ